MDLPFPKDVQEFDGDDRISFSKLDNKFIAVHDDGTEFEFDTESKRWVPAEEEPLDDEIFEAGGPSSGPQDLLRASHKRQLDTEDGSEASGQSQSSRPKKKQKAPPQPKQNTAVYVTGLPTDATVSEVHDLFSRKGGVIAEEIDSGAPRIKMYNDESGTFKGDALVVFFKPQSVEMAIMLLDDTDFRLTSNGTSEGRMRVQVADSSYKKVQYDKDGAPAAGNGNSEGDKGDRRPQRNERDRQKIIKKTQKMDAKLADWDDDDPYPNLAQSNAKKDRTVILSHMFTLQELEEDPAALLEIKEDIRDECSKLGNVTSVVLYDEEEDGIVSVRFRDSDSATACINMMHGRSFDGRTVQAFMATGKEKFRKSDKGTNDVDSD